MEAKTEIESPFQIPERINYLYRSRMQIGESEICFVTLPATCKRDKGQLLQHRTRPNGLSDLRR